MRSITARDFGADAGVECYTRFPNGDETGWQVKYYWEVDTSLISSLDNSIKSALAKHPKLTKYVVCIPFDASDASDARSERQTPLQKWQAWRDKWLDKAKEQGRSLSIDLWNARVLSDEMISGGPLHTGRILYWFNEQLLTKNGDALH